MSLDDLYRQVIMDHYQHPRNRGHLEDASVAVALHNPSCGDELLLELAVKDGLVQEARFTGRGCSISMASASMLTEAVRGKPVAEALKMAENFRQMLQGGPAPENLGDLASLQGVVKFPMRIKCALLAWDALEKGLSQAEEKACQARNEVQNEENNGRPGSK